MTLKPTADFEAMIADAVNALPERVRAKIKNVAFLIDTEKRGDFLGLYHGLPNPLKPFAQNAPPDTITIYQRVVEMEAKKLGEPVAKAAKRVAWHEIGHYFGFGEKKIRELEKKWAREGRL